MYTSRRSRHTQFQHSIFPIPSPNLSLHSSRPQDALPPLTQSLIRSLNELYIGADLYLAPSPSQRRTQLRYASVVVERMKLLHKALSTQDVPHFLTTLSNVLAQLTLTPELTDSPMIYSTGGISEGLSPIASRFQEVDLPQIPHTTQNWQYHCHNL